MVKFDEFDCVVIVNQDFKKTFTESEIQDEDDTCVIV